MELVSYELKLTTLGAAALEDIGAFEAGVFCGVLVGSMLSVEAGLSTMKHLRVRA